MKHALLLAFLLSPVLIAQQQSLGLFEDQSDVGASPKPGSGVYSASDRKYTVTGGGANIWGDHDAFHFVWKKVSGDVTLTADVRWTGAGQNPHRKAALMIRQSLEPNSPYVDIAVHGDGLTALQYRTAAGAVTEEQRAPFKAPARIRITRRGNQFSPGAAAADKTLQTGNPITVKFQDPVYVGLAVSSHDESVLETAEFSRVGLSVETGPRVRSVISIYDTRKSYSTVVLRTDSHVEAPNWSPDGKYLMVNAGGKIHTIALDAKRMDMQELDLGTMEGCNNDHGIAPDGKTIAISAHGPAGGSQVYLAGKDGTSPRLLTAKAPSYFHGFSPDGKYFAFVGERNGNFDLYRMPATGGNEERLTENAGYDDGPDYSPDGAWIYFNSDRSGTWDIWRIPANGAGANDEKAERVTSDAWEDWFPHPSPDGKWLIFLSFKTGTKGHPANQQVLLRRIPLPGAQAAQAKPETLVSLFGGQGTMNVNSWSPDGTRFAFVRYELP